MMMMVQHNVGYADDNYSLFENRLRPFSRFDTISCIAECLLTEMTL